MIMISEQLSSKLVREYVKTADSQRINYLKWLIEKHGAFRGFVLMVLRLLRCHPFCAGGHDPVPDHFEFGHAFRVPERESSHG